jgi:hypothetical protein
MAAETVVLAYEANLDSLQKTLAKIPGMTKEEAQKAVKELRKSFLAAENASKKAAKASSKAFSKSNKTFKETTKATGQMQQGLQAVAQQMPDVVSQLSSGTDAMTVFTQQGLQVVQQTGLAQRAIVAMSGAAIPATAAVGGLATAAIIAANKFDEARDATRLYREALEETNIAATQLVASQLALAAGSDDVSGFVADLEIKTALLNGQLDNVYVTAGQLGNRLSDELEPSIRAAGMAIAENENQQQKLSEAIKSGTLGFDDYTHAVKQLEELKGARPELEQNLAALKEEAQRGREAINRYTNAQLQKADADEEAKQSTENAKRSQEEYRLELEQTTKALEDYWSDKQKRNVETMAAVDELHAMAAKSAKKQATEEEILAITLSEELQAINKIQQAYANTPAVVEAANAAKLASAEQYNAAAEALEVKRIQADQQRMDQQRDDSVALAQSLIHTSDQLTQARMQNIDTTTAAGRAEAEQMFNIQKALAIVSVIIDGAVATSKAFGQFGPPPSPMGIAAAAAAAAQTTAAAALIASQKPEFPMGGIVPSIDHQLIAAQPGEAVLNRSAVDRLGPSGVDAINNGRMVGGEMVVQMVYEHRVFNSFVADSLSAGGPLTNALNRRSGPPGHSRRRR